MHFFILLITLGDISMIIVFIVNQYLVFIIKLIIFTRPFWGQQICIEIFFINEAAAVFVWLVWFLDLFIYLCLCPY